MPNLTGHFSGKTTIQTTLACSDIPGHELSVVECTCQQTINDENWGDVRVSFWGTSDRIEGEGPMRGYFRNEHPNGDSDCGAFDGHVSVVDNQTILEGTWRHTHGNGQFASISGNGRFKGRMASSEIEIYWHGNYQIAAGTRAA
jgi:hypothetical protein